MYDELSKDEVVSPPQKNASEENSSLRFPGEVSPSILIVDDNLTYRLVLGALLEQMGAVITQAVNGDDAISRAAQEQFDVVLMDIGLPDMDGFEAAERIQNVSRDHVPVIACTAYDGLQERHTPTKTGFSAVITKPAGRRAVFMAILECLSEKKLQESQLVAPPKPHQQENSEETVLDTESLAAMIGDLAPETRTLILASVPFDAKASLAAINSAALDADLDKLEIAAHQLKGLARTFGARKLAVLTDRLHALSRDGFVQEALECVPAVQTGAREMLDALATVRTAA
ncbi:MAG: Hpt domain-containing response regulator [Hyphomicrobiales bacterium]